MTNVNNSVLKNRLQNKKLFLYLTVCATFAVDLLLTVMTIISGSVWNYGQTILAVALLDAVLTLAVVKSNYRMKYGRWIPVLYVLLTVALIVGLTYLLDGQVYTTTAYYALVAFHVLSAIALVFGMLNSAKLGKAVRFFACILTVIFLAGTAAYTGYVIIEGVFGQGGFGYRPLEYVYNEATDDYTATLNPMSKGDKTKVLAEFNGKPVTRISSAIFENETLKEIYLECDLGFEIDETANALDQVNDDIHILVGKDKVDTLRDRFVSMAGDGSATEVEKTQYAILANTVVPGELAADEIYVTFDYSLDDLEEASFSTIKTWFGKTGDVFDLRAHASDIEYAKNYDLSNEDFLKENYERGGKVLSPLRYDGNDIIGTEITKNMAHVNVTFERIYTVTVGEDNDDLYDLYTNDVDFANNGAFRYVLGSDPYDMLSGLTSREGFTNSWQYTTATNPTKQSFSSLVDVLSTDVTIYPFWILNAPTIRSVNKVGASTTTYGDNLTLTSDVTAPRNDVQLSYQWKFGGTAIGNDSAEITIPNVSPVANAGEYVLTVTASSTTVTSLTSNSNKSITININKKALNFDWTLPTDVYTGTTQAVSASYDGADVINGDVISGYITVNDVEADSFSDTVKNADKYNFRVILTDTCAALYQASNSSVSKTVGAATIGILWDETPFTYNGTAQYPTATATGVGDDGSLVLTYTQGTSYVNAGNNYFVSVELEDPTAKNNYKINNPKKAFNIARRDITLVWSDTDTLVYNKTAQAREVVSVNGEVDGEETSIIKDITYTGKKTNVGTDYTVSATINNGNYNVIDGSSSTYSISAKPVVLTWGNPTLTYNGKVQHPVASSTDVCTGDNLNLSYSGAGKDAGSYTVTAVVGNANYEISYGAENSYVINAKELSLSWGNKLFNYDGQIHSPTVWATNLVEDDECDITVSGQGLGAGTYTAEAVGVTNSNYVLPDGASTTFVINRVRLTIKANDNTITYGDAPANNGVTITGFVNGETESVLSGALVYGYNYEQYGNVGDYVINVIGYTSDNYDFDYRMGNLTVVKRNIAISVEAKESAVGEAIVPLTYIVTEGSVFNDDEAVTLSTTATAQSPAGEYIIKVSSVNGNYNIVNLSSASAIYTVTAAQAQS